MLMINDDLIYAQGVQEKAKTSNILIEYAPSLEEGIKLLLSTRKFVAVILDDIGLVYNSDEVTDAFASKAVMEIRNNRPDILLLCITTEKFNEFKVLRGLGVAVFRRDENHISELIKFLQAEISRLPILKLREQHKDIFKSIEVVFPSFRDQHLFESLLEKEEVIERETIVKNLFSVRILLEKALLNLYADSSNLTLKEKGSLYRLIDSIPSRYFHDIYKMKIKELYRFCSKVAIHEDKECGSIPITKYTNKRCTYELLEILYYMISSAKN